jgi:hypothetical protein
VNWKGNLNYWTGGVQSCTKTGVWEHCVASQTLEITQNLTWGQGQPDSGLHGKENCMHLRIYQNASGAVLTDRNCKDKYILACKVISVLLIIYSITFSIE